MNDLAGNRSVGSTLRTVHVPLGARAYDVLIGPALLADTAKLIDSRLL